MEQELRERRVEAERHLIRVTTRINGGVSLDPHSRDFIQWLKEVIEKVETLDRIYETLEVIEETKTWKLKS